MFRNAEQEKKLEQRVAVCVYMTDGLRELHDYTALKGSCMIICAKGGSCKISALIDEVGELHDYTALV